MRMPRLSLVGMRMTVAAGKITGDPVHHAGKSQDAEQNQHQPDGEFHREAETRRDHDAEEDNERTHDKNGDGMAEAPEDSNQRGAANRTLAADDGGDGNDMVGVGGVTHAKKESQRDNGEEGDHAVSHCKPSG